MSNVIDLQEPQEDAGVRRLQEDEHVPSYVGSQLLAIRVACLSALGTTELMRGLLLSCKFAVVMQNDVQEKNRFLAGLAKMELLIDAIRSDCLTGIAASNLDRSRPNCEIRTGTTASL